MLVGELEGEVSTDRLEFEAFKEVEKFDFVTVKNPKEGQEWILAQVDEVIKQQDGKTEAEAQVIGYRENGMLKQPRHVVDPDAMVYRADEEVIAETLGLTQDGLYLGRLDTNPDISIFLDPEDLYKHIAVLAKTGAGKSYFTGVMIEELLEADYPVVIIDPHGEYHTLAEENQVSGEEAEKYGIDPKSYRITEYSTNTEVNPEARELSFSSRNLDAKEIEQVVPTNLTNAQLEVLYNALKDLENRDSYTLQDVIDRCMEGDSKAKWNLVSMLEVVQDSNLFSDSPTDLEMFVESGEASIVNLKGSDPEMQEMAVYKLSKELFEKRKRGELEPFVMVMEEAHNFVPERNFGKAVCSDILRTIASEGRKFGLGIG
ncbi:MAG: ATP-binding protein, partial [Candidatus Nanohaloarchaea archaeon]|nr:ATP-binding protein [Candidatus Nanohaloarchaea archaeon]